MDQAQSKDTWRKFDQPEQECDNEKILPGCGQEGPTLGSGGVPFVSITLIRN